MAAALALGMMVGPATAALADGGPDRVSKVDRPAGERPGFGDHLVPKPARPGYGDRLQPGAPAQPAARVVVAAAEEAQGGLSLTTIFGVAAVAGLAAAMIALVLKAVRRRQRLRTA